MIFRVVAKTGLIGESDQACANWRSVLRKVNEPVESISLIWEISAMETQTFEDM